MDDRYLFYALSDEDYFDVPWADGTGPELTVPAAASTGYRVGHYGPWRILTPRSDTTPEAGWKIHVSALTTQAQQTVDDVAVIAAAENVAWKTLRTVRLVAAGQGKYAPTSFCGKVCVLYPLDDGQLLRLLKRLGDRLAGRRGPAAPGDVAHHDAPLGIRWGSFQEHWISGPDGRPVPGVASEHGDVPDNRESVRREPPETVRRVLAGSDPEATGLPLSDVRLIQRCNAGALYRARLADGREVAVKEARHHVGLDADGDDAVDRLRREWRALRLLAGSGIAPEPIDYWESSGSDLLVMAWVTGESLATWASREHPHSRPGSTAESARRFREESGRVMGQLSECLRRLHENDLSHGDLHPGNVVLSTDGVRLVDLEFSRLGTQPSTPAVATPGFQCPDPSPRNRDRFSLQRIAASLHDPDVGLMDRRPDLRARFIGPADPGRCGESAEVPVDVSAFRRRLARDLQQRATPERADRLFPGGIEQFTTPLGGHGLLSGAAGVLLALQSAGQQVAGDALDWLTAIPTVPAAAAHGLLEGVEGIALALTRLGRPDSAGRLLDRYAAPPMDRLPLGYGRGAAGLAVSWVELGSMLSRDDLLARGLLLADGLVRAVDDARSQVPGPGLLSGWAGIASALLRIRQTTGPGRGYAVAARQALHRELGLLRPIGDLLVAAPGGRVRVGMAHGSASLILAAAAMPLADPVLDGAAAAAARACARTTPPVAGLFDGLTGCAAALRLHGDHQSASLLETRATWHCVPTARGWSTLGAQRLRCSDDLLTGSAGLIAGLGADAPARLAEILLLPAPCPSRADRRGDDSCHRGSLPVSTVGTSPA